MSVLVLTQFSLDLLSIAYTTGRDLQDKLFKTIVANYILWPAAHFINFRFVPSEQRIAYNNVVSVRIGALPLSSPNTPRLSMACTCQLSRHHKARFFTALLPWSPAVQRLHLCVSTDCSGTHSCILLSHGMCRQRFPSMRSCIIITWHVQTKVSFRALVAASELSQSVDACIKVNQQMPAKS